MNEIQIIRCDVQDIEKVLRAIDALPTGLMVAGETLMPLQAPFAPLPMPSATAAPSDSRFEIHFTPRLGEPTACGLLTSEHGHPNQPMCSLKVGGITCAGCVAAIAASPPVVHKGKTWPHGGREWICYRNAMKPWDSTTEIDSAVTCPDCIKQITAPKALDAFHICQTAGVALCGMTPDDGHIATTLDQANCLQCLRQLERIKTFEGINERLRENPPASPSTFAAQAAQTDKLVEAQKKFDSLVGTWLLNFGTESPAQPDRMGELVATFSGYGSGTVWKYIETKGGLTAAILDSMVRNSWASQDSSDPRVPSRLKLAKMVALNMVQVGSATGFPLRDYCEACVVHGRGKAREDGVVEPDESLLSGPMCGSAQDEPGRVGQGPR